MFHARGALLGPPGLFSPGAMVFCPGQGWGRVGERQQPPVGREPLRDVLPPLSLYVGSNDNPRASVSVVGGCLGWHGPRPFPRGPSCYCEVPSAPRLGCAGPRLTPTLSPAHITRPPSPLHIPPRRSPGSEVTGLPVGVGGPDSMTHWRLRTNSSGRVLGRRCPTDASLSWRSAGVGIGSRPSVAAARAPRRLVCGPASVARRVNGFSGCLQLPPKKMSHGPTLFSCGVMGE